ncbi:unnamed protein product [Moneuplotes crassus]|uniref:Uncharacterized protein n=1 Tax=Euplotes crassus TaxID=5936 RepID=A0AAD1XPX5_EUPCR|nr:unnamed protein product [Moneuplotes crassus]
MWRKTFFCWPLLSGVKTVAFFDIAMVVISSLFLLLVLALNDDGAVILILAVFEFLLVTIPRGAMGILITKKKYPQNIAKYYAFVRVGTMLPMIILNILEMGEEAHISEEKKEEGSRRGSKGSVIFFGVIFLFGNIILDLFFAHVLFSYFKNGNEYDPRRTDLGAQNNQQVPQGINLGPNGGLQQRPAHEPRQHSFAQHPEGIRVGGEIDENQLEGKDPKVVGKELADIELSLNGGINQDNELDEFNEQPGISPNISVDDTPPDVDDYYNGAGNQVVDAPNNYRVQPS